MPNWIRNRVVVKGKNAVLLMKGYISLEEEIEFFDFEKIDRCPQELTDTVKSSETPTWVYEKNLKKYGYETWYEWRCDHWGCKWNSCSFSYVENGTDEITLYYETAWDPSLQAIKTLSSKHKDLEFTISWSDEDFPYNEGDAKYVSGLKEFEIRYDKASKEAYEHGFELWEENKNCYIFDEKENNYKYKEDYD